MLGNCSVDARQNDLYSIHIIDYVFRSKYSFTTFHFSTISVGAIDLPQ